MQKEALLDKLWARMNERGDFPMLSQSLRATLSAMERDDYDFTGLVQVILSDFALTQKVIRLANSAMYMAFGGNITTVSRALMVLGMEAVGHLVVGLKLVDHFHQNATQRIDAKLELNRAMLAGSIARKLTEQSDLRMGEEAVVCTLLRQIGKLLVLFYLEAEWAQIQELAQTEQIGEDQSCRMLLGVTFEELGQEAGTRWRLPEAIRAGMSAFVEQAGEKATETATSHVEWLRAVSSFSTDASHVITHHAMGDETQCAELLGDLARRYGAVLQADPAELVKIGLEHARDETGDTVMAEIVELRASALAIAAAQPDPQAQLKAGLEDLRSLPAENTLSQVLTMASETMLAGLGLARTLVFVRDNRQGVFAARFGFGPSVGMLLPRLRFDAAFAPDVFHLAVTNSVGIFIENARDPKIVARLPGWFRDTLPDTRAFVLLPVLANNVPVALLYGDWTNLEQLRKITPQEMSVLNELGHELSRFFQPAATRAVEKL